MVGQLTTLEIASMSNSHEEFYQIMGPFLSRRDVVGELGHPVWDEDARVWTLARMVGELVGFVAALPAKEGWHVGSLWVCPSSRRSGVASRLLAGLPMRRQRLTAVVTEMGRPVFERAGFVEEKGRGRFVVMVKPERL